MNSHLQSIVAFIQNSESITEEEKTSLLKNLKDADKEFAITEFKLERSEKIKRATNVLLEETIEELDQKRKAVEQQNRELEIEAALDRIRGKIASMRSTEDLNHIIPVVWSELITLNVPFFRCGIFIVDEVQDRVHIYLSRPDGNSLAALNLPIGATHLTRNSVASWRKEEIYKEHWNSDDFVKWMQSLIDRGQIKGTKEYQDAEQPPGSLDLHFIPFSQGMLYVGNTDPLSEGDIELVKSVADAFSVAFSRYEDFKNLEEAKSKVELTLNELKATQSQLIQSEKMASLGELTAGIAHEIQNPLNFVNNFSELNTELIDELMEELASGDKQLAEEIANDIKENEQKINHHGKRAESIVKGMLLHSRGSTGQKEPTDINALCDEYLRLSYHGFRAKDKSFNADFKFEAKHDLPKIRVVPQDIGRVLLNLINNAFYVVNERAKQNSEGYKPFVTVKTETENNHSRGAAGQQVLISVKDNGPGIPENIKAKIFQPFFTTKPTGSGTGLGLSLSYDIVKAHGGELKVESIGGDPHKSGTEFTIILPLQENK